MVFILFICVVVLSMMVVDLRSRVSILEDYHKDERADLFAEDTSKQVFKTEDIASIPGVDLEKLQAVRGSVDVPVEEESVKVPQPVPDPEETHFPPVVTHEKVQTEAVPGFDLVAWMREDFLIKFGGILLFLGLAWFVSYAFVEGWIGPSGRIILGLVLGGALYGVSQWRMGLSRAQGLVINALGTGTILVSVYAGRLLFDLPWLSDSIAFVIMVAAISYTVYVSIVRDSETLAIAAAVSGLLVPILANADNPSAIGLFSYLLLLSVSFVWVVYQTGWSKIILTLLVGVQMFLLGYSIGMDEGERLVLSVFVGLFAALFYAAGVLSLFARPAIVAVDVSIIAFNAVTLWYWIYVLAPDALQAATAFAVALVAAGTAFLCHVLKQSNQVAMMHASLALLFGFVGTAWLFDGFSLALAYTLEVGLIMMLSLYLSFKDKVLRCAAALFLLPGSIILSLLDSAVWRQSFVHPEALASWVFVTVVTVVAIYAVLKHRDEVANIFATVAVLFMSITTAVSLESFALQTAETVLICTIVYGLVAAGMLRLAQRDTVTVYIRHLLLGWFIVTVFLSTAGFDESLWETGLVSLGGVTWLWLLTLCGVLGKVFYDRNNTQSVYLMFALALGYCYAIPYMWFNSLWSSENVTQMLIVVYALYACGAIACALTRQWSDERLKVAMTLALLPVLMSITTIFSDAWGHGIAHTAMLALVTLTIISSLLLWLCMLVRHQGDQREMVRAVERVLAVSTVGYIVALIWLSTHALFAVTAVAVMLSLFLYAVIGLGFYIYGRSQHDRSARIVGMTFLVGIIIRLLLVDVWQMEIIWRITTFIGVGVLFIVTSFIETGLVRRDNDLSDVIDRE